MFGNNIAVKDQYKVRVLILRESNYQVLARFNVPLVLEGDVHDKLGEVFETCMSLSDAADKLKMFGAEGKLGNGENCVRD